MSMEERRKMRIRWGVLVGVGLSALGCTRGSGDAGPSASAGPDQGGAIGHVRPPSPPPGRTLMPTLDEWNSQRKEVTVKGSSALGCETKMVREYLRVSCGNKNDSGGTPTTVRVTKGGRGEALTFATAGVTALIVPFVEGTDLVADFSWTDKSHPLLVKWARGAARPIVVGVFEGARSPLDRPAGASAEKLCQCHKQVTKAATCDDLLGAPSSDCERTYGNDCAMLLACSRGEPGALPTCLPGYVNAMTGGCFKQCGAGKPACPSGQACQTDTPQAFCLPTD